MTEMTFILHYAEMEIKNKSVDGKVNLDFKSHSQKGVRLCRIGSPLPVEILGYPVGRWCLELSTRSCRRLRYLEEEGHDQEANPLIEACPNYGELA